MSANVLQRMDSVSCLSTAILLDQPIDERISQPICAPRHCLGTARLACGNNFAPKISLLFWPTSCPTITLSDDIHGSSMP